MGAPSYAARSPAVNNTGTLGGFLRPPATRSVEQSSPAVNNTGTLGGFLRPPATRSVEQSSPAVNNTGTLGGFLRPPATRSVEQSSPALTRSSGTSWRHGGVVVKSRRNERTRAGSQAVPPDARQTVGGLPRRHRLRGLSGPFPRDQGDQRSARRLAV